MKTRIFFCIVALSFSIQAWSDHGKWYYHGPFSPKIDSENDHGYTALDGAYFMLPLSNLNSQLKLAGFTSGFNNAIGIGIDKGGEARSDEFRLPFVTYLGYHYLLPQEISTSGDSLKMKLKGYNFQFDLLGWNYLNKEDMLFSLGLGWAFGRLNATENSAGGTTTFLNKYFAPELRMEFNKLIGEHFYLGVRGTYRYDVTKTGWSREGVTSYPNLPATQMNGAMFGAFIGYGK